MDKLVIHHTAGFNALRLPLVQHCPLKFRLDLERDVQIVVVLILEVERHVRRFEERQV